MEYEGIYYPPLNKEGWAYGLQLYPLTGIESIAPVEISKIMSCDVAANYLVNGHAAIIWPDDRAYVMQERQRIKEKKNRELLSVNKRQQFWLSIIALASNVALYVAQVRVDGNLATYILLALVINTYFVLQLLKLREVFNDLMEK